MANSHITKIEFLNDGYKALLESDEVRSIVEEHAQRIANEANANGGCDGYKATVLKGHYGGGRYVGIVAATDKKSLTAESENQALTRTIS